MRETWSSVARRVIDRVVREVGTDDVPTLRRALRAAYPFGQRKYYPYKAWLNEVKKLFLRIERDHPKAIPPQDYPLFSTIPPPDQ